VILRSVLTDGPRLRRIGTAQARSPGRSLSRPGQHAEDFVTRLERDDFDADGLDDSAHAVRAPLAACSRCRRRREDENLSVICVSVCRQIRSI
jgi:hypothetical protein